MMAPVRIGIVGFGRIGRNLFRIAHRHPLFEFAVISDLGRPEVLEYLLERDSVYGPWEGNVVLEGNSFLLGGRKIRLLGGGSPGEIPWGDVGVDTVIDATGRFRSRETLSGHLRAGARRVIFTTPPTDTVDRVAIIGVNEDTIAVTDRVISATSSTTHVLALMLTILDARFGVMRASMTTVHAYTSDQPVGDSVRSELRRSRSAAENIIPNKSWAPEIVGMVLPKFRGKIDGNAFNVPVPDGSCVDLTAEVERPVTAAEVNAAVREAAEGRWKGIVGYTEDPIVSSDVIGAEESMIFDARATMVTAGKMIKTVSWYDNGWGYSKRIVELVERYATLEARA